MAEALQEEYDYEEEQFEELSEGEEYHRHHPSMMSPPRAATNRKNHALAGSTFTQHPELRSRRPDGEESSDTGVFDEGGYMMEHMGYGSYGEESGGRLHKDLPRVARPAPSKPSVSSTVSLRPSHTGSSGSSGQQQGRQAGGGKSNLTFKQEQLQNMERENERLLSSMVRIHQRGAAGTFSVNQHYVQNARHVASNLINRQKQAREIQRANQMMAARLESVRGTVRVRSNGGAQQTWRAKPQRAERLVQPEWQS